MTITITIPGEPIGKGRPRFAKGRTYTPKRTVAYERTVQVYARQAFTQPLSGPVMVRFHVTFAVRPSWSKAKTDRMIFRPHTFKPDLSNIIKAIEDGMEGIAYNNDSQIAAYGESSKMWGRESGVVVSVKQIGG